MIKEDEVLLNLGGNYKLLSSYLDRRSVKQLSFSSPPLVVSSAPYVKLSTAVLTGRIAKGTSTKTHEGVVVAELITPVGTPSLRLIKDSYGNILNKIAIRDYNTREAILAGGKSVFGLVQCSKDIADGTPIGATGSENLQITFAYTADNNAVTAVVIDATIEFQVNILIVERFRSIIEMEVSGNASNGAGGGGSGGGDLHLTFIQSMASATWTINHSLGKNPSVVVVDDSDVEIIGDIEYVTSNQIVIRFSEAITGKVYLN